MFPWLLSPDRYRTAAPPRPPVSPWDDDTATPASSARPRPRRSVPLASWRRVTAYIPSHRLPSLPFQRGRDYWLTLSLPVKGGVRLACYLCGRESPVQLLASFMSGQRRRPMPDALSMPQALQRVCSLEMESTAIKSARAY